MHTIISIDGGGIKGAGPARFLAQAEAQGLLPIPDLLAGSSAGGLLAILRATGRSWNECVMLFNKFAPYIFLPPPLTWKLNPFKPKYQDRGIREVAEILLGKRKCSEVEIPFMVTTWDAARGRAKIIDHTDDLTLAEAVLRTTAAPTYFPPQENRWLDGGLVANNPCALAIIGLHRRGVPLQDISCLSLATGADTWIPPKLSQNMTKLQWVSPVIESQMDGNEEVSEFQATALLGLRHLRVCPHCEINYPLDAVNQMFTIANLWEAHFDKTQYELVAWLAAAGQTGTRS